MATSKNRFALSSRASKADAGGQMLLLGMLGLLFLVACSSQRQSTSRSNQGYGKVSQWCFIEDLPADIAQFETVFWDPLDTISLRNLLRESDVVRDKRVLEIGTGSGLLSLCALQAGARSVVATDINSNAVSNARYNAFLLGVEDRMEVRWVPPERPGAYEVIEGDERFDVIISNPPWVNQLPVSLEDFAFYDASFNLMQTLLDGLPKHLRPGGRALLAYGSVTGIKTLKAQCVARGYSIRVIDDQRDLAKLDEEFLPGMLFEVELSGPRR